MVTTDPPPPAEYYLLMTGLNDARLHGEDPAGLTAYGTALAAIFGAFSQAGPRSRVIAVEQPYLSDYSQHSPYDKGSDAVVDAYNERLREVAARHASVVLCLVEAWNRLTMIAADTVHPNDLGHWAIARAVYDAAVVRSRR
jgi:lysophospholipase L1-like esterase